MIRVIATRNTSNMGIKIIAITDTGATGKYSEGSAIGVLLSSMNINAIKEIIYPSISDPESPINILRLLLPKTL